MVKLKRRISYEAKKNNTNNNNESTTKELMDNVRSVLSKCESLGSLLSDTVKKKIKHIDANLNCLYVTLSDAELLENKILNGEDDPPMSPAHTLAHLDELEPIVNSVNVRYNNIYILNPRVFFLLKKKFNALNQKNKECNTYISFGKDTYDQSYSLYTEEVHHKASIFIDAYGDHMLYVINDSLSPIIDDLKKYTELLDSYKREIKDLEQFLKLYDDIDTPLLKDKRNRLNELRVSVQKGEYIKQVVDILESVSREIKNRPTPFGRLQDGIEKYRNENTTINAINKSNLDTVGKDQAHIVVSLHLEKTSRGYIIFSSGNSLSDTNNLHVDINDHLVF